MACKLFTRFYSQAKLKIKRNANIKHLRLSIKKTKHRRITTLIKIINYRTIRRIEFLKFIIEKTLNFKKKCL